MLLNILMPQYWPMQSRLSHIIYTQRANEFEEDVTKHDPMLASWFASARGEGASSWLSAIPSLACFRVSSQVSQVMLCNHLLALVPGTAQLQRCVCGYSYKLCLAFRAPREARGF